MGSPPLHNYASAGGAPAPRRPAAQTTREMIGMSILTPFGRRTAIKMGLARTATRARAEPERGEDRAGRPAVRPVGAPGHSEADGRRAGDRGREQQRRR